MALATPYLMFVGDAPDQLAAKVAIGVVHWRPEWCKGQLRLAGCKADLGIPDMTIADAVKAGCKTMVIGVANRGGVIPDHWTGVIVEAIEAGMDVAAGLHRRLCDVPAIAEAAARHGRLLTDARHPSRDFDVASGQARAGRRLLTVGTDVSVGKMFTSLAIERDMKARGMKADFRATGQTGIFIAGEGASVDAVVADFIAGAAEWLTHANDPDHWDVVEGQGSLFHASYSGVTLGLIHGSRPHALVLCHDAARREMRGTPGVPVPALEDCIAVNERMARMFEPDAKVVGVSVNTSSMDDARATAYLAEIAERLSLPAVDAVRTGVGPIVDAIEKL
ncbi:MAG: N-acetyltransferase DgcN [Rhodospirillales bacterium]